MMRRLFQKVGKFDGLRITLLAEELARPFPDSAPVQLWLMGHALEMADSIPARPHGSIETRMRHRAGFLFGLYGLAAGPIAEGGEG